MTPALPSEASRAVDSYLADVDRLLPGRITGFHVVGSVALGAFRPRRSDIDFVAIVDRGLTDGELRRLRAVHLLSGARKRGAGRGCAAVATRERTQRPLRPLR